VDLSVERGEAISFSPPLFPTQALAYGTFLSERRVHTRSREKKNYKLIVF
jgi:hypothetical protein